MKDKCLTYKTWETFKEQYGEKGLVNPFVGINNLFYGYIPNNEETNPKALSFEKTLGFTDQIIEEYFTDLYFDRPMAYAYNEETLAKTFSRLRRLIQRTTMSNLRKYYAALVMYDAEYKPIENYNMVEKESLGRKQDNSKSTTTPSGSTTTTPLPYVTSQTTTNKTTTYDDDSFRNLDSSKVDLTYAGTEGSTTSFNDYNVESQIERTNSKVTALGEQYNVGSNAEETDRVLTRSGNIGVTTSQQMLQSEIELKAYNVMEIFFEDIRKEILLSCWL